MLFRRICLSWTLLALILPEVAAAQEVRVTVTSSSAKELKRTAHRTRITVERLKNIREVLQQATSLVRRMDPMPIQ